MSVLFEVKDPLVYIDCTGQTLEVLPGDATADCIRQIVTLGTGGSATPLQSGCCIGPEPCACNLCDCITFFAPKAVSGNYSYKDCNGVIQNGFIDDSMGGVQVCGSNPLVNNQNIIIINAGVPCEVALTKG
jgi:hypothetical protein